MLKIEKMRLSFDNHEWLFVNQPWSNEISEFVIAHQIDAVSLNYGTGWEGDNLDFLKNLKHLKKFTIIDHSICDIGALNGLFNLEYLQLNTSLRSKAPVDFENFPELRVCRITSVPKDYSLFESASLEELEIREYKGDSFTPFTKLRKLRDLRLDDNRKIESLSGIEALLNLERLSLGALTNLSSIAGLGRLPSLRELVLSTCRKVNDVKEIANIKNLDKLGLQNLGNVESLTPLASCNELGRLTFFDTNVVDGDLSFLFDIPRLQYVNFTNKRHYSHKRDDFKRIEATEAEKAETEKLIKEVNEMFDKIGI